MDLQGFYIKHFPNGQGESEASDLVSWKTCLREIVFGFSPGSETSGGTTDTKCSYYRDVEAYQFLMQVVCGLKSPMVGETEVFGQYKKFVENFVPANSNEKEIKKILVDIRNTCKKVRAKYLINLGAQSYGSLLRKKIDFSQPIHILGAGQFVEDIVPWLSKKSQQIVVHSRSVDKSKAKPPLKELTHCHIHQPTELKKGYLIIAAPLSAQQIQDWMANDQFAFIFDLRGESKIDPLSVQTPLSDLQDFFKLISNNKQDIEQKVEKAETQICCLVESKLKDQKLNPFGWDDLCA